MERPDAQMDDADAEIANRIRGPRDIGGQVIDGGKIEPVHRKLPIRHYAVWGCSLTRETSCVGLTKRSAISSHTSVTAM